MAFKSAKQRKAVMAKLHSRRYLPPPPKPTGPLYDTSKLRTSEERKEMEQMQDGSTTYYKASRIYNTKNPTLFQRLNVYHGRYDHDKYD